MFVEVGGISVVPVLLKLLPEDTFGCELLLKTKSTTSKKSWL